MFLIPRLNKNTLVIHLKNCKGPLYIITFSLCVKGFARRMCSIHPSRIFIKSMLWVFSAVSDLFYYLLLVSPYIREELCGVNSAWLFLAMDERTKGLNSKPSSFQVKKNNGMDTADVKGLITHLLIFCGNPQTAFGHSLDADAICIMLSFSRNVRVSRT